MKNIFLCLQFNYSTMNIALKSNTENKAFIEALRNGDMDAFENLYKLYFKALCAFSTQYVPLIESEEIVQDTMMWVWEKRSCLIDDLNLKSLLFTIVKNKSLNRIAHTEIKRKVHQEIIDKFDQEFSNPDFYLENELFEIYEKALSKLPPEFRECYELNRNHQMIHKEIAEKLNVSPQTVNYRISQALKILRKELKDYLPLFTF